MRTQSIFWKEKFSKKSHPSRSNFFLESFFKIFVWWIFVWTSEIRNLFCRLSEKRKTNFLIFLSRTFSSERKTSETPISIWISQLSSQKKIQNGFPNPSIQHSNNQIQPRQYLFQILLNKFIPFLSKIKSPIIPNPTSLLFLRNLYYSFKTPFLIVLSFFFFQPAPLFRIPQRITPIFSYHFSRSPNYIFHSGRQKNHHHINPFILYF